jgi:hypothetical protein
VDFWLDDEPGVRLVETDTDFREVLDISHLGPGEHRLLLAANGSDQAFAERRFRVSHPLYVVVTTDWDDADNSELSLTLQEELHEDHPQLLVTHFVGPYTFTDPALTPDRVSYLSDWVTGMRDTYGDEIGLHIHPYCNFVESAGLTCADAPSTVYSTDATGYTVMLGAYSQQDFEALLAHADSLFEANGLGKPTSFRAGGWTAELSTLRALAAQGYVADTSANNWRRMEEWEGVQSGVLYEWNSTQWSTIDDTSQPYYPSQTDIVTTGSDIVPILEVPDNGILVDYVTSEEMVEIFSANWNGDALSEPTQFSIGWHPSNFSQSFKLRMHRALTHVDQYLALYDNGPVVYSTLSDLAKVWPQPQE